MERDQLGSANPVTPCRVSGLWSDPEIRRFLHLLFRDRAATKARSSSHRAVGLCTRMATARCSADWACRSKNGTLILQRQVNISFPILSCAYSTSTLLQNSSAPVHSLRSYATFCTCFALLLSFPRSLKDHYAPYFDLHYGSAPYPVPRHSLLAPRRLVAKVTFVPSDNPERPRADYTSACLISRRTRTIQGAVSTSSPPCCSTKPPSWPSSPLSPSRSLHLTRASTTVERTLRTLLPRRLWLIYRS